MTQPKSRLKILERAAFASSPTWALPGRGKAAIGMPFQALIITGRSRTISLCKTEVRLKKCPVHFTSIGLKPRSVFSELNDIHSIFKSF